MGKRKLFDALGITWKWFLFAQPCVRMWSEESVGGYVRSGIGFSFLPEQYRSSRWMESSWGRARSRGLCRSNRSRQRGRWWYPERTRWSHGTIQRCRRTWRSSWCSQPGRCTGGQQFPCRHQHPSGYERNPMDRRSKERWLQQHHRIPSCRRSSARTVSSGQRRPRRFVCRHPWRRSWGPGSGNIWWRWPSYRARKRRSLVPLEYGRSNRWCLQNKNSKSAKVHELEVKLFSSIFSSKFPNKFAFDVEMFANRLRKEQN